MFIYSNKLEQLSALSDAFKANNDVVGIDDSVQEILIKKCEGGSLSELVVVYFSNSTVTERNNLYSTVKNVIGNCKKACFVVVGDSYEDGAKLIALLFSRNKNYNMYRVDSASEIGISYINRILAANGTQKKVLDTFGIDVAGYGDAKDLLKTLAKSGELSAEEVKAFVKKKRKYFESMVGVFGMMEEIVDECKSGMEKRADEVENNSTSMRNEVAKLKAALSDERNRNTELMINNDNLTKNYNNAMNEIDEMKKSAASRSKIAANYYVTVDLNKFTSIVDANRKAPIVKAVLYFKEVTYCRYTNSMILALYKCLTSVKHKKCKVLIYDQQGINDVRYGNIPIIGAEEYDTSNGKNYDILVVKEAARQIIEDALTDNEIVIIYDRLHSEKDVVEGRKVTKFYVTNSSKEIIGLERAGFISDGPMKYSNVITSYGTFKGAISVREIIEYKDMSMSGKVMNYINMVSTADVTKTIFELMFDQSGMTKLLS